MREKLPEQLRLLGEPKPSFIVVIGKLPKMALAEVLKLDLSGWLTLQTQFSIADDQPQVGLSLWLGICRMAVQVERAQDLIPILNFLRAAPTAEPLLNRRQIRHRRHEFRDGQFLLES